LGVDELNELEKGVRWKKGKNQNEGECCSSLQRERGIVRVLNFSVFSYEDAEGG
jgi:hypothetical protein